MSTLESKLFLDIGLHNNPLEYIRHIISSGEVSVEYLSKMRFEYGSSLVEHAIGSNELLVAEYLLDLGLEVNVVTKDSCNEFHILADFVSEPGGIQIGWKLLDRDVDLSLADRKYRNTAMFEIFLRTAPWVKKRKDCYEFLIACFEKKKGIYEKNVREYNCINMVHRFGLEEEFAFLLK